MFSPVTAAVRLLLILAWTAVAVPVYSLRLLLTRRRSLPFHRRFWGTVGRIAGFEVVTHGGPCGDRPLLFVSNHASYLDIIVLGGTLEAYFVAKKEVASWPLIGLIARLAGTVFVERRSIHSAEQRDEMRERLRRGQALILFPEGTSDDGNHVLPFKSALFSVAEGELADMPIQPVSVAYTRLDGLPVGHDWRALFAWYGGMTLAPHAWRMLGLGRKRAEVIFHEPLTLNGCGGRKAAARRAWKVVSEGVAAANAGRLPPPMDGSAASDGAAP